MFADIPEFFFGGSNSMSVTLDAGGGVSITYSGLTAPEGITGVSAGDGSIGTALDLSSGAPLTATGTSYEEFIFAVSEFDLDGTVPIFDP